jgi:hypothetical protein
MKKAKSGPEKSKTASVKILLTVPWEMEEQVRLLKQRHSSLYRKITKNEIYLLSMREGLPKVEGLLPDPDKPTV